MNKMGDYERDMMPPEAREGLNGSTTERRGSHGER